MKVEIDLNSKHYDPKVEYKLETGLEATVYTDDEFFKAKAWNYSTEYTRWLEDVYPYRREL